MAQVPRLAVLGAGHVGPVFGAVLGLPEFELAVRAGMRSLT